MIFVPAMRLALCVCPPPSVHLAGSSVTMREDTDAGPKLRPLQLLMRGKGGGTKCTEADSAPAQSAPSTFCKYDAIRELTASARERSYSQGRDGCCSKTSSYLDGDAKPPATSPWARTERSDQ
jgi:hypothetical protein